MKKIIDLILALIGIIFFSPLMFVVAIATKLTSKGPILFKQKRTGFNGKEFYIFKFRTMRCGKPTYADGVTSGCDPRITQLGKILRKTKIDELPQLFNIVKGEMSFVGPRPDVPEIAATYIGDMKRILSIMPGITSIASLHLRNEEELLSLSSNPEKYYKEILVPLKVALALEHADKNSILFDFSVLLKTVWMVSPFGKIFPIKEHALITKLKQVTNHIS